MDCAQLGGYTSLDQRAQGGGMARGVEAASADPIAAAHARLFADPSFQFVWSGAPRPTPPPTWLIALLKQIGRLLQAIAPEVRIGFWVVLGAGAVLLAISLVRHFVAPTPRQARLTPLNLSGLGASPSDAAAKAAVRLAEADRLAAEGRYAEAAHLLLLRSVADVESGRPGRIRPSFTSRDIAALPDLGAEPRAAFSLIAGVVERALFGGRLLDAEAWRTCRTAYGALTRPEAWAGDAVQVIA